MERKTKAKAMGRKVTRDLGQMLDTSAATSDDATDLITVLVSVRRVA